MDNDEYFKKLSEDFHKAYEVAKTARSKGFDPKEEVEILPAPDLASRVEGLIGVKGIGEIIRRKLKKQGRSKLAFEVAEEICKSEAFSELDDVKRIELAVRVGTAILTEGILVAPTEGMRGIEKYRNQDGTPYIAAFYAGPIRGAGGTAAALSVALADYTRKFFGIDVYKPTQEEIERYVEEAELYHTRAARLQYRPPDEDIRVIAGNCPVCIEGVPTETIEVSVHGNLKKISADGKEVPTPNRVRGGISLVMCEGIAQKAKKMLKETKSVGLDWSWLNTIIKVNLKKSETKSQEEASVFLEELVAGRPILAYPGKTGGFRLRYGRSRLTGIAAKGFSPATMIIADNFIAIGTQLKVEFPGKGCVALPVDSIEGPFVVLKSGDAFRVNDAKTALEIKDKVAEIISLGDLLATYGDFKKSNTQLQPSSYVEEFWSEQLNAAVSETVVDHKNIPFREAFELSLKHSIPMHPKFLFEFQAVSYAELRKLAYAVSESVQNGANLFSITSIEMKHEPGVKRALELLNVPHRLIVNKINIYDDNAQSLVASLGLASAGGKIKTEGVAEKYDQEDKKDVVAFVNTISPFRIMKRSTYIGARIGRPEKARERLMKPAPHVLFPIGTYGGNDRNISKAYLIDSKKLKSGLTVDIAAYTCRKCKRTVDTAYCADCGEHAFITRKCPSCGNITESEKCEVCKSQTIAYGERNIDLAKVVSIAMKRVGANKLPDTLKGVRGMTNKDKVFEPIEKGILRAQNGVFIFKDGTSRFDATDVPMTHFYPSEIGTSVERLRELGYTKDYEGKELERDDQLVEMRHQDCVLSRKGGVYMLRVARFVDQMLEGLYGTGGFYNAADPKDLVGHLAITLSPHTSCGVLNRIIGFADVNVGFAHPYTISARRRNCDGDEDTTMLLLDGLINFSREFLPTSVGGTMDAPLVLTLNLLPEEVDDEAHAMEVSKSFGLPFYEKTLTYAYPSDVEVEIVEKRLGTPSVYGNIGFTHATSMNAIAVSPKRSQYTQFKTMHEKVDGEFVLMDKIYAIDKPDAARKLIISHFIPDLIGNLHSFSRQNFRCSSCNAKYRRVPLTGKCTKDNGKLLLTISKAGIEKYLEMAIKLADRYELDPYIRQRLVLVREEIASIFASPEEEMSNNTSGQFNLGRYM
ncbi:MAG TPA: DNA polymerase II large subunit [Candidatus Saccharimonadales bacterium]|nr:DNA polymerase II large subunit [Candidatus Saccharimonadales bacterium]